MSLVKTLRNYKGSGTPSFQGWGTGQPAPNDYNYVYLYRNGNPSGFFTMGSGGVMRLMSNAFANFEVNGGDKSISLIRMKRFRKASSSFVDLLKPKSKLSFPSALRTTD